MLRWANIAIVLMLFFVACGLSGLAIYESSAYQKCSAEAGGKSGAEHQGQEEVIPLIGRVRITSRCAEQSIAENNAVVSAVATVVIAVFTAILGLFTMSLARSTGIAAAAAKQSADHIPKVERAYLFGAPRFTSVGHELIQCSFWVKITEKLPPLSPKFGLSF
jgi:hypothetical protein